MEYSKRVRTGTIAISIIASIVLFQDLSSYFNADIINLIRHNISIWSRNCARMEPDYLINILDLLWLSKSVIISAIKTSWNTIQLGYPIFNNY